MSAVHEGFHTARILNENLKEEDEVMTSAKLVEAIVMEIPPAVCRWMHSGTHPTRPGGYRSCRTGVQAAETAPVFRSWKKLEGLFIKQIRPGSIPAMTIRMATGLSDSAGLKGLTSAH